MKKLTKFGALILISAITSLTAIGQTAYQSKAFDIRLNGTSNIHDWEMKAQQGISQANFTVNANGQVTSLNSLSFSLPAANLKSGHSAMDKNTMKALNAEKNPSISF